MFICVIILTRAEEVLFLQRKQRQDALLQLLALHGYLSVREMADRLQVSDMTIRRDLQTLAEAGKVEVLHGGGQILKAGQELAFSDKRGLQTAEKTAIAKLAWSLVEPSMVVGFSAGTTTWTMAQHWPGTQGLTFVTNSTNVALALSQQGAGDILLSGGSFRTPSDALVGPLAERAIRQVRMDILFLGVHGIDCDTGISTPNLLEAATNRALMEQAHEVVVLFDHSKWGVQALGTIAAIDEVDQLITDARGGSHEVRRLQQAGVPVLVAPVDHGEARAVAAKDRLLGGMCSD